MTKASLENMVKWMSKELSEYDIRVNAISPGVIKTYFSTPLWKNNTHLPTKAIGEPS